MDAVKVRMRCVKLLTLARVECRRRINLDQACRNVVGRAVKLHLCDLMHICRESAARLRKTPRQIEMYCNFGESKTQGCALDLPARDRGQNVQPRDQDETETTLNREETEID